MDTTGGTPTLHAPVSLASFSFPTSPIASFPISPLDSEVPGDAAPQGHGWMSTGVAPSYYSAYDSVLGYESRSATNVRLYEGSSASKPGFDTPANSPLNHREEVRRQRNKSEQQRRDGLRGGFARLKDILPVSNQRGSKMSLVDRGRFCTRSHVSFFLTDVCLLVQQ
ncbi:hypothetical protein FRC08_016395 [Ceratobasidium sp. 394]|nr:hypothetical protein FRC08_016395 [Ceratobasidium sp. 394]